MYKPSEMYRYVLQSRRYGTVFNAVKSVKQNLFVDEDPDPHNGRTPGSGSSKGKTLPKKKLLV